MAERPVVHALLPCEAVIVEERTRNVSLMNVFTHRVVDRLPSHPLWFVVRALMPDGAGTVPLELEVAPLDGGPPLKRFPVPVTFPDPLQHVWLDIRVRGLVFPAPGPYEVVLSADGESLARFRFNILLVQRSA